MKDVVWIGDTRKVMQGLPTVVYKDAIYVLHVFEKKRQKTSKPDIDLVKRRLAELRRIVK